MKKVKFSYLFIRELIACFLAIGTGFGVAKLVGMLTKNAAADMEMILFLASFLAWVIIFTIFASLIDCKIAKKTMAQKSAEIMNETIVFYGENGILKLDAPGRKIAYVSNLNPYELQMIPVEDISDIVSQTGMVFLGGTRYVYFEFLYKGKQRMRFPTFSSRQSYSLKSSYVIEAIAKADTFCEMLRSMKAEGMRV